MRNAVAVLVTIVGITGITGAALAGSGVTQEMRACREKLNDQYVIADARLAGMSKEDLIAAANEKLEGDRRDKALVLIEEAYAAEDVKAWFQERYWFPCLEERGHKTGFHRVAQERYAASSQKLYCEAAGETGERMARDFRDTEFRPEHLANDHQRAIARLALACERAGEQIAACVMRRCMERGA